MSQNTTITLGGGCFWCVEAVFEKIHGITKVVSGYSGGSKENPTYQEVCSETTGHAEVVQVSFNDELINIRRYIHAHPDLSGLENQTAIFITTIITIVFTKKLKLKEVYPELPV